MSERQSGLQPRDTVHSELASLLGTGGPLHARPDAVADELGESFVAEIAISHRAATHSAPFDGKSAIITAGPPGAGKSRATSLVDPAEYRRIDADQIKDRILWVLDSQNLLSVRHDHILADGKPVSVAELSWWVHHASTAAADLVRAACLADGENFLMEGTLSWHELPELHVQELADFDYDSIKIIDVEVPLKTAQAQARARWWKDRNNPASTHGGRFVSDAAIAAYYPNNEQVSICATRARNLYARSVDLGFETTLAMVSRSTGGREHAALITPDGVRDWQYQPGAVAPPMGAACLRCGRPITSPASIRRGLGNECRRLL